MTALSSLTTRLGAASTEFECCDTTFTVEVRGVGAERALDRARDRACTLEAQLNAFDADSAVAELNETGKVDNRHVARLVRRGLTVHDRTGGVFDVRRGRLEHVLKSYLRGETASPPEDTGLRADVSVTGDVVEASEPVDLNGLAKGYIVDRVRETAARLGRGVFVDGGGDMTPPSGPVAIESPWGGDALRVLDTDWSIATSGGYRRQRGGLDHIYDPTTGSVGSTHDIVTVLARSDCTTADALATTLSVLDYEAALELAEKWDGLEAFVVTDGVFRRTEGLSDHVLAA